MHHSFLTLLTFVEKRATVANTAFVKLVGSKSDGFRVASISLEKKLKMKPEDEPLPKAKVLATKGANGKQTLEDQPVSRARSNLATQRGNT